MITNITIFSKEDTSTRKELSIKHDMESPISVVWEIIKAEFKQLAFIKYNSLLGVAIDFKQILMGLLLSNDKLNCTKGWGNEIPNYEISIVFKDKRLSGEKVYVKIKDTAHNKILKDFVFYVNFPIMNCVDRFINIKANDALEHINKSIDNLKEDSIERNEQIQVFGQYHNTAQYERDFRNLTELIKYSKALYEDSKKFLNDLTYVKYTE